VQNKKEKFKLSTVASSIEEELNSRIKFIDSVFNTDAISRNNVDINQLNSNLAGIYKFKNDEIIAWNTDAYNSSEILSWDVGKNSNITTISNYLINIKKRTDLISNEHGDIDTITYQYIIPIAKSFNNNTELLLNEELNNNIHAQKIHFDTEASPDAIGINNSFRNEISFYISYTEPSIIKSSLLLNSLFLLSILLFIVWTYKFGLFIKNTYHKKVISLLFVIIGQVFLNLLYKSSYFIPSILQESDFLSPSLLSSSYGYTNLFLLIFNLLSFACVALFILRVLVDNQKLLIDVKKPILNKSLNFFISLFLLYFVFDLHYRVTSTLVFDSKIPLVTDSFLHINMYTICGLFVIFICNIIVLVFTNIIWIYASKVWKNQAFIKLLFFLFSTTICAFLYKPEIEETLLSNLFFTNICILLFSKIQLPLLEKYRYKNVYISWQIWILLVSCICSLQLLVLNNRKEIELRKTYIQSLSKTNDVLLEYTLSTNLDMAIQDSIIIKDLANKNELKNEKTSKYILNNYFKNIANNYAVDIKYYNSLGQNIDSTKKYDKLSEQILHSNENYIMLFDNAMESPIYYNIYFKINEYYVAITLLEKAKYKKIAKENGDNIIDNQYFSNYSIGIYKNGTLVKNYDNANFKYNIDTTITRKDQKFASRNHIKHSELYYNVPGTEYTILIYFKNNIFVTAITTFSFLIVVAFIVYICYMFIRNVLVYNKGGKRILKSVNWNINARINITIWSTVLLSFGILGTFTIYLLRNNEIEAYNNNNINKINIIRSALSNTETQNAVNKSIDKIIEDFNYRVILYDSLGVQIPINKFSNFELKNNIDVIHPKIRRILLNDPSIIIENVAHLGNTNLNCITASLNINGKNYITRVFDLANSSTAEDNIADMMLMMLNIYILIITLTSVIAYIIARSATKPIELIVSKFKNISLKHNELIEWPYNDEFGLLVTEYNNMILKVEELASKISVQERESVWKEMAQQVAHEIKNPLTPMKLNIQYLKRAIDEKRDNVEELTTKVCNVLEEQIDNLTHIATEFSAFAKIPNAEPTVIEINEKIKSLVKLFEIDQEVTIDYSSNSNKIFVFMDNSYLIRSLTNIIKNGIQAVPAERNAEIHITTTLSLNRVTIAIQDNGNGIPKDRIDKMFMPYFTSKSSGTGIGLSMTKNMIEISKGTITFETKENSGTIFYITLPILAP